MPGVSRPLTRPPGDSHAPLTRPRAGRLLGGVCAGLAGSRGLSVGAVRAVFLAGTLLLGLGAVVYLACWLIVPDEAEDPTAPGARGIVVLAQACGAAAGLAVLAAIGASATIFGFGWVTVAVAGTILLAVLAAGVRLRPAWALLPVGALVLPSVALAAGGVALAPVGAQALAPATLAELPAAGLRSGLEPLFVDLRRTALPPSGVVPLRVDAGIRRTIIALPHDRCVNVDVRYDVSSFAARAATVMTGRYAGPLGVVSVFGGSSDVGGSGRSGAPASDRGPTLRVDFRSQGGGLYIRDYPDTIDPRNRPDYPGYPVTVESRPTLDGLGPRRRAYRLERWRVRRAEQLRSKRRIDRLMPGPCAVPEATR